jgi:hypothetical protein
VNGAGLPAEAVQAVHSVICDESLEDHLDPEWPGRCVKAVEAAAPHLMAQAFDEGQKSGMRHADRLVAAEKIGRPDLPGPLSPNPYRKDTK